MLEWSVDQIFCDVYLYIGKYKGEIYAKIATAANGKDIAYYQFKGLKGYDFSYPKQDHKIADNLEHAKKICEGMMSAWKHKFD